MVTPTLRSCGKCEWIFIVKNPDVGCPKCGFGHFGARSLYGNRTIRYFRTQNPWFDRKMGDYAVQLQREIAQNF